jgi:hypothetical protein
MSPAGRKPVMTLKEKGSCGVARRELVKQKLLSLSPPLPSSPSLSSSWTITDFPEALEVL